MVILDELNVALRYGYLDLRSGAGRRCSADPSGQHVVITGRNAAEALMAAADLVTEMTLIKHPVPRRGEGPTGSGVLK